MKMVKIVDALLIAGGILFFVLGALAYSGVDRLGVWAFGCCLILITRTGGRA